MSFRISPKDLFGSDALGDSAKLAKVIFITRTTGRSFYIKDVSPSEMSVLNANVIMPELNPLSMYLYQVFSTRCDSKFPISNEVYDRTRLIYEKAFKNIPCFYVAVPEKSNPEDLYNYFKKNMLLK